MTHGSVQGTTRRHAQAAVSRCSQRPKPRRRQARDYKSWDLSERQLCDIELILNGAFSPLEGFLGKADYDSVLRDMRLRPACSGRCRSISMSARRSAETIKVGETIALRDPEGVLIATLQIQDIWTPDKAKRGLGVFGTDDAEAPRRGLPDEHGQPGVCRRHGCAASNRRPTMISRLCAIHPPNCAAASASSAGARSWRSRRATRCIALTRN